MPRTGWKREKLGKFFQIKHGYAFKGEFFADEGKYILLTPGNFKAQGGLKHKGDKEKYFVGEFPEEYLLRANEMLVVMTDLKQNAPILGSPAFIPEDEKYLHNQRLGKIIDLNDKQIDKDFLFYLLNSHSVREQIKATATGSTVKHTAPNRIYEVNVEVPNLPTQRKIAAVLSAYDDLIENNARRIEILEAMARTIYREWFVEFRFPGHEDVGMIDPSEKQQNGSISPISGSIPYGWQIKSLKEFCHLTLGVSPKSKFYNEEGDGLPFHQGVSDFGDIYPTTRRYCTVTKRMADDGDILFSVRAPVGRINLADRKIVIGRGLHAIRSKTGHQMFVLHQLKDKFEGQEEVGSGTIFKSVTKSDMLGIQLLVPPEDILDGFEEIVVPMFKQIEVLTRKNAILRQTRNILLPRLVNGEFCLGKLKIG